MGENALFCVVSLYAAILRNLPTLNIKQGFIIHPETQAT
jgi:hypothetical protein